MQGNSLGKSEMKSNTINLKDKDTLDREKIESIGYTKDNNERTGSFTQVNDEITESYSMDEGVEVLTLNNGLEKYPWLRDYLWKIVDPQKDQYTEKAFNDTDPKGYFIYVKKGAKIAKPLQACFFLKADRKEQIVHNLILMEENSELHIINGCAAASYTENSAHYGITEVFIKKNAFLSYTMIHDWAPSVDVRPRSAVHIEENGHYISNYIALKEVHSIQTNPVVTITGKNGKARLNSIIYAPENSRLEVGGKIILDGEGASGEIISRTVSNGGTIIAPAEIEAKKDKVSGFMECSGLLLKDYGQIYSLPSLNSFKQDVELSHEASIGKIGADELNYLMSRGLSEADAKSLIIHGFLDLKIKGLPDFLQKSIDFTIQQSLKGM